MEAGTPPCEVSELETQPNKAEVQPDSNDSHQMDMTTSNEADDASTSSNNKDTSPRLVIETSEPQKLPTQTNGNIKKIAVKTASGKSKLKKTEIGLLVVKLLTPAYVDKRFESREIFKTMARKISHWLADKGESGLLIIPKIKY